MEKEKQFNKKTIKEYKGRLVALKFNPKKSQQPNTLTGEITASTSAHILFKVNKNRPEIPLNYSQIVDITEPERDNYQTT